MNQILDMEMKAWLQKNLKYLKRLKSFLIAWIPITAIIIIMGFVTWDNLSRLAIGCVGVLLGALPYHIRDLYATMREIRNHEQLIDDYERKRNVALLRLGATSTDAEDTEINPRTGEPYKTSKAQRESSKKWKANHPERNSTESSKEYRRKYMSRHSDEHKEKYVQLYYNGLPRTAKKEHCHRVIGSHGREKWEVLPQFRDVYAWCRGVQDEKKNA